MSYVVVCRMLEYVGVCLSYVKLTAWAELPVVDPGFTKGGGHKIMDLLSITKTSKWEVVKNSASPK